MQVGTLRGAANMRMPGPLPTRTGSESLGWAWGRGLLSAQGVLLSASAESLQPVTHPGEVPTGWIHAEKQKSNFNYTVGTRGEVDEERVVTRWLVWELYVSGVAWFGPC